MILTLCAVKVVLLGVFVQRRHAAGLLSCCSNALLYAMQEALLGRPLFCYFSRGMPFSIWKSTPSASSPTRANCDPALVTTQDRHSAQGAPWAGDLCGLGILPKLRSNRVSFRTNQSSGNIATAQHYFPSFVYLSIVS